MPKPIPYKIRLKVLNSLKEGQSARTVAAQYNIAPSTVSRWIRNKQGPLRTWEVVHPKRRQSRKEIESKKLLQYLLWLKPKATLSELQVALHREGITVSKTSIWRIKTHPHFRIMSFYRANDKGYSYYFDVATK